MTLSPADYETYIKESNELAQYVGLASFTALVWDHFITLGDEIEYIWKRKKGPLIYLFFLVCPFERCRPITPLTNVCANIADCAAYMLTTCRCQHFVRYEGSMTVIGINTTALMMLLRIYAMYEGRKLVVLFVTAVFLVEFGVNAWLLTHGVGKCNSHLKNDLIVNLVPAVRHSAGITAKACTMIFDPEKVKGPIASASAWLPLLYDTIVLLFTLKRTYRGIKNPTAGRIMRILLKEGLMYYSVIFSITLILTLMIVFAPDGLKNLTAHMTVAMMSRITLHLKKQAHATWDSLGLTTSSGDPTAPTSPISRYGGLRFARGTGAISGGTAMNITIQEYSVMHDDHGDEIELPAQNHVSSKPTLSTHPEWHELGPVRVSIQTPDTRGRVELGSDPGQAHL
ncbi:hypothetical protein BV20DRAFT_1034733 [Pilatotrama ljubarskyi]|nr:hypothetical protein BV20DRAFT_1034733 [Pilatotrama ljubarskyi]